MVEYRGEKFSGYNKPKRTSKHTKKSHAVLAKEGSRIKLIRFGQQGVKTAGKPKRVSRQNKKTEENLLKPDMARTLPRVKCQQHIGLIK